MMLITVENIKCMLWLHEYEIVKEFRGVYSVTITSDEGSDLGTEYYDIYLSQCVNCGKRKMKVVGGSSAKHHQGIKKLKYRWVKYGDT